MKLSILPDHILKLMSEKDRKAYAKSIGEPTAGMTAAEAGAANERRGELVDHAQFINFCNLKGIIATHANPTRKSTIKKGALDFGLAYGGRALFLEFKAGRNKLTPEQEDTLAAHAAAGNPAFVVRSLSEAIERCYQYLPLK